MATSEPAYTRLSTFHKLINHFHHTICAQIRLLPHNCSYYNNLTTVVTSAAQIQRTSIWYPAIYKQIQLPYKKYILYFLISIDNWVNNYSFTYYDLNKWTTTKKKALIKKAKLLFNFFVLSIVDDKCKLKSVRKSYFQIASYQIINQVNFSNNLHTFINFKFNCKKQIFSQN